MTNTASTSAHFLFVILAVCASTLGSVCACGEDIKLDRLKAKAQRGSVREQIQLAKDYFYGNGTERSETLAATWFERAANSGDPDAQRTMGYLHSAGIGVPKDPARAVRWFQRAAAGGSIEARSDLGVAYLWGIGVKKDPAVALRFLRQAAKKGSGRASCYLGDLYQLGIAVDRNEKLAAGWYGAAADHHDPFAQYKLGVLFTRDESRSKDFVKGISLLRDASHAGLTDAKYMLGLLLTHHPELSTSPAESESELNDAARAGFWRASAFLGSRAANGTGSKAGSEGAYYWFRVARLQGGEDAASSTSQQLEELSRRLETAQKTEIDLKATKWFEQHKVSVEFVYPARSGQGSAMWGLHISGLDSHVGSLVRISTEDSH